MLPNFVSVALICVLVGVVEIWAENESRIVETKQGPVRGYKDSETGIYSFWSIPYATAPTGQARFKPPLPPPTWMQPFEAVNKRIICPQIPLDMLPTKQMQMQENCLIVNIHVPDTQENNLPVYVHVHGGGFQVGYGEMMHLEDLSIENNVIVVSFNYRLGPHGFLCLGTEDAPGNAGMKDQVALLKWVKENIVNFGGNPDAITIGGCSAGGAAVDLLTVSKAAEGLFNKAIPESGANVGVWSVQMDPIENAKEFAKALNFTDVDDFDALLHFYKTVPFTSLQSQLFVERTDSSFVFVPCVEKSIGQEMFFDDHPVNIIKNSKYKKVPLLYGFAQMEGLMKASDLEIWKDRMNDDFTDFLPTDLKFKSELDRIEAAKEIKQFYFGQNPINESSILNFVDFIGDVMFAYPHLRSVQLQIENGHDQIYLYEYSFVDENDPIIPHTNMRGANHCNQYFAVCKGKFDVVRPETKPTEEFLKISSILRKVYANFIKKGKPVVDGFPLEEWPPVKNRGAPYMAFGVEIHLEQKPMINERVLFWDKIYDKYYREPVPPLPPANTSKRFEL